MPLIYRSMLADGDKPLVGSENNNLGVRVRPHPRADIPVNPDGSVSPSTGGLSVNPSLEALTKRPHLVPRRLKNRFPGARGVEQLIIWRMGEGVFQAGAVADSLMLRPDKKAAPEHGVVEPERRMLLEEFQNALAATREQWERGEE